MSEADAYRGRPGRLPDACHRREDRAAEDLRYIATDTEQLWRRRLFGGAIDLRRLTIVRKGILTCEECLEQSNDEARGWIALLAEDVHGLEPMSVAVFCPEYAKVEFGYRAEERGED